MIDARVSDHEVFDGLLFSSLSWLITCDRHVHCFNGVSRIGAS